MATFPNEEYPADSAVLALDGSIDEGTGLPFIAKGVGPASSPTLEVQYNRRLARQNTMLAAIRQGMVVGEAGLKFGVYPLTYWRGTVLTTFDGATDQSLTDDATNYIWLDSANTLQVSTGGFTGTGIVPLARVVVASGVKEVIDDRSRVLFQVVDESFARSGANSDITSLAGLSTPLSVAQGGTGLTAANVVPFSPSIILPGTLSVKVYETEFSSPVAFTLVNARGRVATAPTGDSIIMDVRVDGVSIFSNQGEMINIPAAGQSDVSATKNHAVSAGDVITVEVEQVGSSVAGADATVVLNGRTALQV